MTTAELPLILPRVAGEGDHPKAGGGGGQGRRPATNLEGNTAAFTGSGANLGR